MCRISHENCSFSENHQINMLIKIYCYFRYFIIHIKWEILPTRNIEIATWVYGDWRHRDTQSKSKKSHIRNPNRFFGINKVEYPI